MKTNFILNLKQSLLLFIAVLGTFVSFAQTSQNPTIGGGKSSDGGLGGLLNIGGTQGTPRDTGGMITLALETKTDCIFAYPQDTGGGKSTGGTDTGQGQFDDHNFEPFNIGGKSSSGGLGLMDAADIGGRGTSSDTGQFNDDDTDPYDIGGRGGHTGTGTGESFAFDTGGRGGQGTSSDTGQYDDDNADPYDIGGRNSGGRGTNTGGEFAALDLVYFPGCGCIVDTGGRNGSGTSTTGENDSDTGGRGTSTTTGEFWPDMPYSPVSLN